MQVQMTPKRVSVLCALLVLTGCAEKGTVQATNEAQRAVVTATKLRYVPPGTTVVITDRSAVAELRQFFTPKPESGHERTPAMFMGAIVFTDREEMEHGFNFGLSEWSAFESDVEYPLPAGFHDKLRRAIEDANKE